MNIYIAASFDSHEEMRILASQIEDWTKHKVVSRWHGKLGGAKPFEKTMHYKDASRMDVEDLKSADILLSIGGKSTSGGRFVEFGMAWAWNIQIIHLGERENVFFWLPGVHSVPNRGALFDVLREKYVDADDCDEDEIDDRKSANGSYGD